MAPYVLQAGQAFIGSARTARRNVLGGAAAGGGGNAMTSIAETTVSGGAVATMSLTLNLQEGKSYFFGYGVKIATSGAVHLEINADSTDANYALGGGDSTNTWGDSAVRFEAAATGSAGDISVGHGRLGLYDSVPYVSVISLDDRATGRCNNYSVYSTTETTFASIRLSSGVASVMDNDSWLKVWRID